MKDLSLELEHFALIYFILTLVQWSLFASLAAELKTHTGLLLGITLFIGGSVNFILSASQRSQHKLNIERDQLIQFAIGLLLHGFGIGLYHYFIFQSFKLAPAVEANLIQYLWPTLLLLGANILSPSKIKVWQLIFTVTLSGTGLLILFLPQFGSLKFNFLFKEGHAFALGAALTWASYSLLLTNSDKWSRNRLDPIRSEQSMAISMLVIGALCLYDARTDLFSNSTLIHLKKEAWRILLLGCGPMGLSFLTWKRALESTEPKLLASLSNFIPLLSMIWLIAFGISPFNWSIIWAGLLMSLAPFSTESISPCRKVSKQTTKL